MDFYVQLVVIVLVAILMIVIVLTEQKWKDKPGLLIGLLMFLLTLSIFGGVFFW